MINTTTATSVGTIVDSGHRKSAVQHIPDGNFSRTGFVNWVKAKDTIVDTLFILGPSNEERLADMAKNLTPKSIPEIAREINKEDGDVIEPKIISQYPEFNREQIDTDET